MTVALDSVQAALTDPGHRWILKLFTDYTIQTRVIVSSSMPLGRGLMGDGIFNPPVPIYGVIPQGRSFDSDAALGEQTPKTDSTGLLT